MAKSIVRTKTREKVEGEVRDRMEEVYGKPRGFIDRIVRDKASRKAAKGVLSKQREVQLPVGFDVVIVKLGSNENTATASDIEAAQKSLADGSGVIVVRHDLPVRIERTWVAKDKFKVVRVGSDERPACGTNLDAAQSVVASCLRDPSLMLVTHHAFEIECVDSEQVPALRPAIHG